MYVVRLPTINTLVRNLIQRPDIFLPKQIEDFLDANNQNQSSRVLFRYESFLRKESLWEVYFMERHFTVFFFGEKFDKTLFVGAEMVRAVSGAVPRHGGLLDVPGASLPAHVAEHHPALHVVHRALLLPRRLHPRHQRQHPQLHQRRRLAAAQCHRHY